MMIAPNTTHIKNARELVEALIARDAPDITIIEKLEALRIPPLGNHGHWWTGKIRPLRQAIKAASITYEPEILSVLKKGFETHARPSELQPLLITAAEEALERKLCEMANRNIEPEAPASMVPWFEDIREVYRVIARYRTSLMLRAPVMANGANLKPEAATYLHRLFTTGVGHVFIIDAMNREGYRTFDGRRWNQTTLDMENMRHALHHMESQPLDLDVAELTN